mmetsp:Transcript_26949/g.55940  ORF Transcript_26949/g.55940 Transcript_26949/m.55940 type:complete len:187 (-) Transcript_26949:117-677(-)
MSIRTSLMKNMMKGGILHSILQTPCKKSSSRPAGNNGCSYPNLSSMSNASSTAGIRVCPTYISAEYRARSNGRGRMMPIFCPGHICAALPAAGGQNLSNFVRSDRDNGGRHEAAATRGRRRQQQQERKPQCGDYASGGGRRYRACLLLTAPAAARPPACPIPRRTPLLPRHFSRETAAPPRELNGA